MVFIRGKLQTPDILSISANFVGGVPEGLAAIIDVNGTAEEVFLKHGVPVGLGVSAADKKVVSYDKGRQSYPVWRFGPGVEVASVEFEDEFVVFVKFMGVERTLIVKGGVGYELSNIQWTCGGGLLGLRYSLKGEERRVELIKEFPPFIDEKDRIIYQMMKTYNSMVYEIMEKESPGKDKDEAWIQNQVILREKEKKKGNIKPLYQKVKMETFLQF